MDDAMAAESQRLIEEQVEQSRTKFELEREFYVNARNNLVRICAKEKQPECQLRVIENVGKLIGKKLLSQQTPKQKKKIMLSERLRESLKFVKGMIVKKQKNIIGWQKVKVDLKKHVQGGSSVPAIDKLITLLDSVLKSKFRRLKSLKREASEIAERYQLMGKLNAIS